MSRDSGLARIARRQAWLTDRSCDCGSTDRLRVQYPPGVPHEVWSYTPARREALLPLLTVRCFECHYVALCARRGVKRAVHGTRSMYRRGCRCQACHDAETAFKKAVYMPVAQRRAQEQAP